MAEGKYPAFSLTAPSRFDLTRYSGRVKHFFDVTDARTLFVTQERLAQAEQLLEQFKHGSLPAGVTNAQLWEARKIRDAIVHPDTGKPIPSLLRMSAFGPVNIPIVTLLAASGRVGASMGIVLFGQWVNQSYNVAVNYANRNATSDMSLAKLGTAYSIAVATSCSIAIGMKKAADRMQTRGIRGAAVIAGTMPFVSVVAAGVANLAVIRQAELLDGVMVRDENGKDLGLSRTAAVNGISKCALARVLWSIPPMLLPNVIMGALGKTSFLKARPKLAMPLEIAIIAGLIFLAVPPAIAVFPQRESLPVSALEPEFQNRTTDDGKPITRVWFNKGL